MKRYLALGFAVALLTSIGCDGCGSSDESDDESKAAQKVEAPNEPATPQADKSPDEPKEPPKPSQWNATITGEDTNLDLGGRIVNGIERGDPSGTGDSTLVVQMMPEPGKGGSTSGQIILRGFLAPDQKKGKLDVIRADVTIPSEKMVCTDADEFDIYIDKYTEFQLVGSMEGTLACEDGKTYEFSGDFRD